MKKQFNKYLWLSVFALCMATIAASCYVMFLLASDGSHWDVTKDQRYSLNAETQRFLDENQLPVSIRLYMSKDLNEKDAVLAGYAEYVRKLLAMYQIFGHDLIKFSVIEVEAFTNTQTEAETAGITEMKRPSGEKYLYLGIAATNAYGQTQTLAQLLPEERAYLEDDVTRMLSVLQQDKLPKIGVLSPYLKIIETGNPMDFVVDADFVRFLRQNGYDLYALRTQQVYIPEGTDAVLVFYPVKLTKEAVFALSQYLMQGGKVVVLLDVFSVQRFAADREYEDYDSGLQDLLQSVGLMYYEDLLAGDRVNSQMMTFPEARVHYPFWLTLSRPQMSEHRVMTNVNHLELNHSGMFVETPQKSMYYTNLLSTGTESGAMLTGFIPKLSYDVLLQNFNNMSVALPLAVLVEGYFPRLFDEPLITDPQKIEKMPLFLTRAMEPGKLLVVGDSDWVFENGGRAYWLRNMLDFMTNDSYVSVGMRDNIISSIKLSDVLFRMAFQNMENRRKLAADALLKTKQELVYYHENVVDGEVAAKVAKEYERLQRQEIEQRQYVEKIDYQVAEQYKRFKLWLGLMLMAVACVLSLAVLGGWAVYDRYRIRRKTKEILHD
jgi:hypothetical protein